MAEQKQREPVRPLVTAVEASLLALAAYFLVTAALGRLLPEVGSGAWPALSLIPPLVLPAGSPAWLIRRTSDARGSRYRLETTAQHGIVIVSPGP